MKFKRSLKKGDIIKFTYKADKSADPIQNVELKIEEATDKYIFGINVNRILDGSSQDILPYRRYKVENIISNTVYLRIA